MVVEATGRLVSHAVRATYEPAVFGGVACESGGRWVAVAGRAVLRLALQSGHGAVAVPRPSDPRESDVGRDGRKFSGPGGWDKG